MKQTAAGLGRPEDVTEFLGRHPDIEVVQLVITDSNGVARGKNVAREELASLFGPGRNVAGSILGLDVTGEDVEETGLVWAVGDADQLCRPVAGTLAPARWLARPTAQVLGTLFELDGRPAMADPRHVLARVVERLEAHGCTPVVAVELEFYLLERDEEGRLAPARGRLSGTRGSRIDAYGLGRLDDMSPLLDEVGAAARAMGLPVRTLMSEYAPGQFEMTLEHRADALRAVDESVMFKRAVRGVAARHGCVACFMAKPFAELAGSGMHLHASLAGPDGRNLCADDDPRGSPMLRQAIGGLRETLADGMAVFAPHANSYRRFRAMSYAPVAATWGVNNRTVGLRVPAGPPATRHVEHRVAGADAIYADVWASMGEESLIAERIKILGGYKITEKMMAMTGKPGTIFLHCLPAFHNLDTEVARQNPDIQEVEDAVFEGAQSRVFDQAENRLHTIKAIMVATLGS